MTVNGTTCSCYHRLDGSPLGEGKAKGVKKWSINKEAENKINAFELRCYSKILRGLCTDKRTNISILEELGNISENWLQNDIMRRKLKYFGHVKRHECLERDIYEGIVEGRRGRGRPRRRWSQDILDRLNTTVTEAGHNVQDTDDFNLLQTLRA